MQQLHFVQHVRIVHYTFIQYCFCFVWHLTTICYLGFNRNVTSDSVFSFLYLLFIKTNYNSNIKIEKKNTVTFFCSSWDFRAYSCTFLFFCCFFLYNNQQFLTETMKTFGVRKQKTKNKTEQQLRWLGSDPGSTGLMLSDADPCKASLHHWTYADTKHLDVNLQIPFQVQDVIRRQRNKGKSWVQRCVVCGNVIGKVGKRQMGKQAVGGEENECLCGRKHSSRLRDKLAVLPH